jgi:trans-L-3-hydroxyproline dehydratase
MIDLTSVQNWTLPASWQKIHVIDAHTAGEPLRIITGGFPAIQGKTILEKRRFTRQHFDHLRTTLMWEPRGHADMYGCLITESVTPDADFGVLFIHNEGFSTMCGHGIIAVAKVLIETGLFEKTEPETTIRIDSPAGLIIAHARISNNNVESVYFINVPSFVVSMEDEIEISGLGKIKYDIAFGGAYYAFVNVEDVNLTITPENFRQLIEAGMLIKNAVKQKVHLSHPYETDLNYLYGTIFTGPPVSEKAYSRNVCIFAEGEVDRSPTGTGVSARMALHHAKGEIDIGDSLLFESILGTTFRGSVVKETRFGPYQAIIPEVEGTAFITGKSEFSIDPEDPLKYGFILR